MLSFICYLEVGLVKTTALLCTIKPFICSVAPWLGGFRPILIFGGRKFCFGENSSKGEAHKYIGRIHDLFTFGKGALTTMGGRETHFHSQGAKETYRIGVTKV